MRHTKEAVAAREAEQRARRAQEARMKTCACGARISKSANACPMCGQTFTTASRVVMMIILGGMIGLVVAGMILAAMLG
jgi:predicted amidophosphoribosyltransferase